jgi:quinol monooxygenase YgiN
MIVGTLRILPSTARRTDVLDVLRSVQGPVRAQPGCLSCHIYEELGPEQAVILAERWRSRPDFEEHLRSEAYRRILGAIELSGAPPEIRFETVAASDGLEAMAVGSPSKESTT